MSSKQRTPYDLDLSTLLQGGLAGVGATVPMTAAMLLMEQVLPPTHRYPLPPEQITLRLAGGEGVLRHLKSKPLRLGASLALHFGFGGAAGALFALLGEHIPLPFALPPLRVGDRRVAPVSIVRGIVFALGVWAASYLGWLPALGVLAPATRHPTGRNILMITAHIVWGACAGLLLDLFTRRAPDTTGADFTGPAQATAQPAAPDSQYGTNTGGANDAAAEPVAGI
jgi:hypothetical protein